MNPVKWMMYKFKVFIARHFGHTLSRASQSEQLVPVQKKVICFTRCEKEDEKLLDENVDVERANERGSVHCEWL